MILVVKDLFSRNVKQKFHSDDDDDDDNDDSNDNNI